MIYIHVYWHATIENTLKIMNITGFIFAKIKPQVKKVILQNLIDLIGWLEKMHEQCM
jgi:hypothetical protein